MLVFFISKKHDFNLFILSHLKKKHAFFNTIISRLFGTLLQRILSIYEYWYTFKIIQTAANYKLPSNKTSLAIAVKNIFMKYDRFSKM